MKKRKGLKNLRVALGPSVDIERRIRRALSVSGPAYEVWGQDITISNIKQPLVGRDTKYLGFVTRYQIDDGWTIKMQIELLDTPENRRALGIDTLIGKK